MINRMVAIKCRSPRLQTLPYAISRFHSLIRHRRRPAHIGQKQRLWKCSPLCFSSTDVGHHFGVYIRSILGQSQESQGVGPLLLVCLRRLGFNALGQQMWSVLRRRVVWKVNCLFRSSSVTFQHSVPYRTTLVDLEFGLCAVVFTYTFVGTLKVSLSLRVLFKDFVSFITAIHTQNKNRSMKPIWKPIPSMYAMMCRQAKLFST